MDDSNNVAGLLRQQALEFPERVALLVPTAVNRNGEVIHTSYTFAELESESNRYSNGLKSLGISKGSKVLLMIPPGFEFVAFVFALFKITAVPVLIDPGMGKNSLLSCVESVEPDAMIAVPLAHLLRVMYPHYFSSVKRQVTIGWRWLWGGKTSKQFQKLPDHEVGPENVMLSDTAAILFTTGSTGPAKGVVYTHGIFKAQIEMIKAHYSITSDDRDYPIFPLFVLFGIAMGMSSVIPKIDYASPAKSDPKVAVNQINKQGVSISFGSPTVWGSICEYCISNGITLPSLTRVLMAGAPVPDRVHDSLLNHILSPGASTPTPFGATEVLPVCDITGREILDRTAAMTRIGAGTCVGRPQNGMHVRIINIIDGPIRTWDNSLAVPTGEIGEIVVSGPIVTQEYFQLAEKTALAKIIEAESALKMHRMGDAGYLDDEGRLWFCGRVKQRVITTRGVMFTIPCEAIFNTHKDVKRSALVGLGVAPNQTPAIIVELKKKANKRTRDNIRKELLKIGSVNPKTEHIKIILFYPEFPTDVRHNAKIFREKLKVWADQRIKTREPGGEF